jgi:hypothetical protein
MTDVLPLHGGRHIELFGRDPRKLMDKESLKKKLGVDKLPEGVKEYDWTKLPQGGSKGRVYL